MSHLSLYHNNLLHCYHILHHLFTRTFAVSNGLLFAAISSLFTTSYFAVSNLSACVGCANTLSSAHRSFSYTSVISSTGWADRHIYIHTKDIIPKYINYSLIFVLKKSFRKFITVPFFKENYLFSAVVGFDGPRKIYSVCINGNFRQPSGL